MSTQKTTWTPAQHRAIYDEGGSLLVSAAAGSGKTAVLVQRALNLITRQNDPMDADRLLILTFTNAAAEELRSRIGTKIEEAIHERPRDARLRRQRLLLKRAFIGTLDAYCLQLVREHFARLDLPADIGLGDEALLEELRQAALADTMEEMFENPDFGEFAALYGRARSDGTAEGTVLALYNFTRTLPRPGGHLQLWAAMYDEEPLPEDTPWGAALMAQAKEALAAAQKLARQAWQDAEAEPTLAPWLPALAADVENLAGTAAALAGGWDAARQAVWGFAAARCAAARGADEAMKQRVKTARDGMKDILAELKEKVFICTAAQFAEDVRAAKPFVQAVCRAVQLFAEKYLAAKLEEKVLDFADFEHLALSLLQTGDGARTPLADRLCQRYGAVMVDEYQDTNELQSALYECLARPGGDNLFYVGDVKQSIYRFRNANPGLFLQKKNSWPAYNEESPRHPAVITLGHNFRSCGAVIAGVNHVFAQLMSTALGEVEYGEGERLIAGADSGAQGSFEVCIVAGDEAGEARHVARRIAQMVADGEPVWEKGASRPCNPGDFCILLRVKKRIPQFMAALEAEGLPVAADLAADITKTPEVLPLVAALQAIDNPGNDVALAAALMGPLFRFSAQELTTARLSQPKGRLWGALQAHASPKTKAFLEQFAYFRALAGQVGVGRLCEELVDSTGYRSAVSAMEDGAARRDNLQSFIGWAAKVAEGGRGGLGGFVRLFEGKAGPQPPAVKTIPGHVSILTIHKSKGLEFPFCFLADAAHGFNKNSQRQRVQMHAQLGVGMALRAGDSLFPTLPLCAIRGKTAAEERSEEMRALYVALTRAGQRMVVTFADDAPARTLAKAAAGLDGTKPDAYLLSRMNSFAAWVLAAALRHEAATELLEWLGAAFEEAEAGAAPGEGAVEPPSPPAPVPGQPFAVYIAKAPVGEEKTQEAYRLTARPDESQTARLRAAFGKTPPRAALQAVAAKRSVSSLAKQAAPGLRRRPSLMYAAGLTAAEKGTAQHTFMQFADFAAAGADLEGEIGRLAKEGYLLPEMAKAVDRAGVRVFLASPLAGRIAAAKRVLREYDFITAVEAGSLEPGLPPDLAKEQVLVQGIADLILVGEAGAEIIDYKTDRNVGAQELAERYRVQLELYRAAIGKRLGLPVSRLTIWAFALGREVEV